MPRVVKPKKAWRAGGWVLPAAPLSGDQIAALAEACGLDPRSKRCAKLAGSVQSAISRYLTLQSGLQDTPRPVHQRAALTRLSATLDAAIEALDALDDLSRDRLEDKRCDIHAFSRQIDLWQGAVVASVRELDGHESRGRAGDQAPRRALLWSLARAYAPLRNEDGADFCEFLSVACRAAGVRLTPHQAKTAALQLLPEMTP